MKKRFIEDFLLGKIVDVDSVLTHNSLTDIKIYLDSTNKLIFDKIYDLNKFFDHLVLLEDSFFQKTYINKISDKTFDIHVLKNRIVHKGERIEVILKHELTKESLRSLIYDLNFITKLFNDFNTELKNWLKHVILIFGDVQKKLIHNHIERYMKDFNDNSLKDNEYFKAEFNDECYDLYKVNSFNFSNSLKHLLMNMPIVINKQNFDGGRFFLMNLVDKYMKNLDSKFLDYDYTRVALHNIGFK